MDKQPIKIKKLLVQLPEISERYLPDIKHEPWSTGKLNISSRYTPEKSISKKNYFLPIETIINSPVENKTPNPRSSKNIKRINEKKLTELDSELDSQEILCQDGGEFSLSKIESLFYSYSSYLESLNLLISESTYAYKSHLTRAKNGFISIFRQIIPRLKKIYAVQYEKTSQTLMTINPTKNSIILSKLGDIINSEISNTDKIEKYIQKIYYLFTAWNFVKY